MKCKISKVAKNEAWQKLRKHLRSRDRGALVLGQCIIIEGPIHTEHLNNNNEICGQKIYTIALYPTLESGKKE